MRKIFFPGIFLIGVLCVAIPCRAEIIRDFNSDVRLQQDGTLDVTETIVIDFENESYHGLYRTIPIKYERYNSDYTIHLKVLSVLDKNGNPLLYNITHHKRNLDIRVGNPDILITGIHTYRLHYLVYRALNFFDGEPEVYFNVTGEDWDCTILRATARFFPPASVSTDQLRAISYIGEPGYGVKNNGQNKGTYALFTSEYAIADTGVMNTLREGEGLTFVVRLPAGSVSVPILKTWWWFFSDWWTAIVPPLISLLIALNAYLKSPRSEGTHQAIGVEWAPPSDLSPAEVNALVNLRCDEDSITATIFDLAARGYLQIHEVDFQQTGKTGYNNLSAKDYVLVKTTPPAHDHLAKHEDVLLSDIFKKAATVDSLPPDLKNVILADQQMRSQQKLIPSQAAGSNNFGLSPYALTHSVSSTNPQSHQESTLVPVVTSTNRAILLSDISSNMSSTFNSFKDNVYDALMVKKLCYKNLKEKERFSNKIKLGLFVGVFLIITLTNAPEWLWSIGMIISLLIFSTLNLFSSAKTAQGNLKWRQCKGFERFVKMVEEPRLKLMHHANPEIFGRLLPYALVLNISDEWAEDFEHIITSSPYYYFSSGSNISSTFSSRALIHNMGNSIQGMNNTFSTAGSGGSGFSGGGSGGGFGGGGGGAW